MRNGFLFPMALGLVLVLPACNTESPAAPNIMESGPALNPAQVTVKVAFSNATGGAPAIQPIGPAVIQYIAHADITLTNGPGRAAATINGTATALFDDNSRTHPKTLPPTVVGGGQSVTARVTFSPKVPLRVHKRLSDLELELLILDDLGNAFDLFEVYEADDKNWGVQPAATCVADETTACLKAIGPGILNPEPRFRAWSRYRRTPTEPLREALVLADFIPDSAVFLFGAQPGVGEELLVQMINNCDKNGHFGVFAASQSSSEFELTVYDTQTNVEKKYSNIAADGSPAITDTRAFATCP